MGEGEGRSARVQTVTVDENKVGDSARGDPAKLRIDGQFGSGGKFQLRDVLHPRDQGDTVRRFPHRTQNLVVAGMADQGDAPGGIRVWLTKPRA